MLDKPVLGAGGKYEQLLKALPARALLHAFQQALARVAAAKFRMHHQARKLRGALLGERIQRGATGDHAVVLQHGKPSYFHFQQVAAALDQRAVGFQRLDQALLKGAPEPVLAPLRRRQLELTVQMINENPFEFVFIEIEMRQQ